MHASALFAVLALLSSAEEPKTRWLVFPVHCTQPPPADPTMLRLTRELGEAIQETLGEDVRVASRELRDERCPDESGACPRDVAELSGSDRAIALVLSPKYDALSVRVFHGKSGVESEGKLPCRWDQGAVACETETLASILAPPDKPASLEETKVKASFDALRPQLARCKTEDGSTPNIGSRLGKAEPPADARRSPPDDDASVSFRAQPDGHVSDVRIDPPELQDSRAYGCMARIVESLRVPPFAGAKPQAFRFSLSDKPEAKAKAKPVKAKAAQKKPKQPAKPDVSKHKSK